MKDSTKVYLYTGGWCLYFLQGVFGMKGSYVAVVLSILLVAISFLYVFLSQPVSEVRKGKIPYLLVALDLFFLVLLISKVAYVIGQGEITKLEFKDLQVLCITLLPVYFYYYYSKKGCLKEKEMRCVAVLFLTFLFVNYLYFYMDRMAIIGSDEFTNNAGRFLVSIVPMLMLFDEKNRLQIVLGLLISFLVMLSAKREALLVLLIEILLIFVWKTKDSSVKQKVKTYLVLLLVLFALAYLSYYMFENISYFQKRIYETLYGNLSGRDRLLPRLLYEFLYNSTDPQFLFGRGTLKTWTLVGNFAHNDLMELATCQGIVGIVFYLNLWLALVCFWKRQEKGILKLASLMLLVDFFCGAEFSRFYFSTYVPLFAMLGFILGKQKNAERRATHE